MTRRLKSCEVGAYWSDAPHLRVVRALVVRARGQRREAEDVLPSLHEEAAREAAKRGDVVVEFRSKIWV